MNRLYSFFQHTALTAVLFAAAIISSEAQTIDKQAKAYLLHALQGQSVADVPHRTLRLKKLSAMRTQAWEWWREANAQFAEPNLPSLDSLGRTKGEWAIPESLEPNATMPYYYGCKGNKPDEGYPLFLYLHGSGPKQHEWQTGLWLAQHFADAPSAYFIPQIPNEGEWYRWWQRSKQYVWKRLLRQAMLRSDINPNRLYVFGISEGGYGSQRLASFYADYWAAAGPMAGGEPLKNAPAENIEHVPFTFHTGEQDAGFYRNRLTRYTADALDSLQQIYPDGYQHLVQLVPGRQHAIDYTVTTPWLVRHERNAVPKHFVWEDFEMDGQRREGFYNLLVLQRPDSTLRTRYEVRIDSNNIYFSASDVHYTTTETDPYYGIQLKFSRTYTPSHNGRVALFLDDRLVDLSRPVSVYVNGRLFQTKNLQLDVAPMLRSIAAFGDPERIFPAAIEFAY